MNVPGPLPGGGRSGDGNADASSVLDAVAVPVVLMWPAPALWPWFLLGDLDVGIPAFGLEAILVVRNGHRDRYEAAQGAHEKGETNQNHSHLSKLPLSIGNLA
jgi:hypothetical protein